MNSAAKITQLLGASNSQLYMFARLFGKYVKLLPKQTVPQSSKIFYYTMW